MISMTWDWSSQWKFVKILELGPDEVNRALRDGRFVYQVGPFYVQVHSRLKQVSRLMFQLYGEFPVLDSETALLDFVIKLAMPGSYRRWFRPKVFFRSDGRSPFAPFPADTAFPLLEWGLNWSISTRAHQYLLLHSAVVEKNGKAVLFPAWSGSGKSTLSAALSLRGWRLLSDEFGIVRPGVNELIPLPRCIPLKNESIEVIRQYSPGAVMGPVFPKTRKGSVAHLRPEAESVRRMDETAVPAFVVFPRFNEGTAIKAKSLAKARAFLKLAGNSFNYELLGLEGFRAVDALVRSSDCLLFEYSNLDEAVGFFDDLVA